MSGLTAKALEQGQLTQLLLGSSDYYLENRQLPFEPQDFNYMWRTEILSYLGSEGGEKLQPALQQAFQNLLHLEEDPDLGLYCFFTNLSQYYLAKQKGLSLNLDIEGMKGEVQQRLLEQKEALLKDERWAGGDWNQSAHQGEALWGILKRHAGFIKDRWKGPDLWP